MAAIAVQPFVLKDVVFTVDQDDFAAHVSNVTFTPTTSTVTWQGLTPAAAFSDATTPTWTCAVTYAQDWTSVGSLAQYLMDNEGTTKTVIFQPNGADTGAPTFTAALKITPGAIGGAVNTVASSTVTLGVDGKPVKGAVA